MSPELFTLDNIFNMNLAQYKDICMEVVGNAVKALSIERTINEMKKVSLFESFL